MAEGEELPPVVATLTGDDSEFLAMLERDVQAARDAGALMQEALAEGFGGVTVSGESIGAQGIAAAGEAIGQELSAGIAQGASGAEFAGRFDEEMTPEIEATIREMNGPIVESMAQAGAEGGAAFATAAEEELASWREAVALAGQAGTPVPPAVAGALASVDEGRATPAQALAAYDQAAGASGMSAAQFNAAAAALRTVGAASGLSAEQLKQVSVSFQEAERAVLTYGTAEAQLAIATRGLSEAEAALAMENAALMQSYMVMAASGNADLSGLTLALKEVSDAQATVSQMAAAQVDALTAVNLAVVQNESALMDDQAALGSLGAAAVMAGVDADELAVALENGDYAALDVAAATAQAELKALALKDAQQQLAAANLTLVDTYARVAQDAEVSAEQQTAALDAVAAAEQRVSALGGSLGAGADKAKESMGGLAGLMNGPLMQGVFGLSAIAYLPMMIGQMAPAISGMFSSAVASASDFTQAVAQDSNAIGNNTITTIQNSLSKSDLLTISQQLGVSEAQLIEYAAGEANIQQQVTDAYNQKTDALAHNASMSMQYGHITENASQKQIEHLAEEKGQLDQITSSVQQAVTQDQQMTAAIMQAEQTTKIFNATMADGYTKMQSQAQSTANGTVSALGFSDAQSDLNRTLVDAVSQYTQASTQAASYASVLAALGGPNSGVVSASDYAMILQGALDGVTQKMQQQAQASALSAVGALDLGAGQSDLNSTLVDTVQAMSEANTQASAYATVLAALGPDTLTTAQMTMLLQGALDATVSKMQAQASGTALSAVAALQLGDNQSGLNLELYNAVDAYSQATAQANGYSAVLTAMDGSMQGMLAAEAQVTIGLDGIAKAAKSNGHSLDINNVHGAQNILTFTQLAQSADKAAEAVYQNDVNTGKATSAYQDANRILGEEKQAFIDSADKAGYNKQQVQQLADELYKLPANVQVDINANTTPAQDAVRSMVEYFDHQVAYVQVFASPGGLPGGKALMADGGPVRAGEPVIVGDGGEPEVFVPGADGYITPMHMLTPAYAAGGPAPGGGAGGYDTAAPVTVYAPIYLDGKLIGQAVTPASRTSTQWYKRRNNITGFN